MRIWKSTKKAFEETLWPIYEHIMMELKAQSPKTMKFVYNGIKKHGQGTIYVTKKFWQIEAKPMLEHIVLVTREHAHLEKAVAQAGKDIPISGKVIEDVAKKYRKF